MNTSHLLQRTLLAAALALGTLHPAAASPAAPSAPAGAAVPAQKVLLVVSAEGRLDAAGKTLRPGFEMEEFAQAWLVLKANGLQLEVASPPGGAVVADRFDPADDLIRALNADPRASAALAATRRTQDVQPGEHAAILVIGGKGAMFDLPRDAALARLLGRHHGAGGVLAAVCHGPAVLASVTTADGRPLVAGRRVTGFTDEEETQFGKRWAQEYPFWLERKLRDQGARWEEAPLMMPKLVVDDRLITGQNPMSTALAAEAVVRALGRVPVARPLYREEASLQLVQQWLAGERTAARALLAADATRYKTDLIAMLGYYQHAAATDEPGRRQAVDVMELAAPHFAHPRFRVALAQAQAGLGNPVRARELLQQVLAAKPDDADAAKALAALAPQTAAAR
jgi:putative intracellular protease/amidase